MKNLSNIIADYLANRTDYAVQIVGPFGHGKTYHYKKVLERVISGTSIAGNGLKKYKPIYISLFGLKSTEEVAAKIVLSFYQSALFKGYFKGFSPWKRLKFTGSILKIGLRGFLNFKRLGSIDDYVADIKAAARNVLDSRELLVCFDDLERRDESLSIHDFAGYINSLTDEGVKVLIIANDDLLLKKEKEYSDLKEKIIGITVEFVPDVAETISSIIEERYKGSPVYHKYLLEHLPLILSFSGSVQHNFRHVGYALDRFHVCYATIRAGIIDPGHEISEKLQEKLTDIMQLILALAAEYKASQLKHTDQDQYEHRANLAFKVLQTTRADTGSREKSRLESFLEKYGISSQNYFFYGSLYGYLTGHDEFDVQVFQTEFIRNFNLAKGKVLEQYEVLNSLGYNNCFDLPDEAYRAQTLAVIEYARKGLYSAPDYISVMHYAERFENILDLDLTNVQKRLLEGLKFSLTNSSLNTELQFSQFDMSGKAGHLSPLNKELYKNGMQEIRAFKDRAERERQRTLSLLLVTNFEEFAEKYELDRQFAANLSVTPVLKQIGAAGVVDFIKKADRRRINFLRLFFPQRFQDLGMLNKEWDTLVDIIDLLADYQKEELEKSGKTIRNYLLGDLLGTLKEAKIKNMG